MNSKFQALRALKAYGAGGAIRIILIGLFFNTLLPLYSQSTVGLADSDQLSTFSEVRLPGDATSTATYASLEALWEMDMSQAGDGDGRNDANQNNHNLFVIDDIVYVYVEKYQVPGETITLRRFDVATGEALSDLHSDFSGELASTSFQHYVMPDEAGHIAVVGLKAIPSGTEMSLVIQVYDRDLEYITTISPKFEETEIGHHFLPQYEWLGITGDLLSGDFSLSIGCWHFWGNKTGEFYYPSLCRFVFSKGEANPEIEVSRYDSGGYEFETRSYTSIGSPWKGMLFVAEADDNCHLVQGFGTTDVPTGHSPILLYKNNGDLQSASAQTPYPIFNQLETLSTPELAYCDTHCFGAFPVKAGDETFLVLPYSRNASEGTKFKLAHWNDCSSFSSLSPLWEFPTSANHFTPDNERYETLRPKVVSTSGEIQARYPDRRATGLNSRATTIFAYMPSSILGAYRLSLDDDPVATGIDALTEDAHNVDFSIRDKVLYIDAFGKTVNVEIASASGTVVFESILAGDMPGHINLRHCPPGVYILRLGNESRKIMLN